MNKLYILWLLVIFLEVRFYWIKFIFYWWLYLFIVGVLSDGKLFLGFIIYIEVKIN